MKSTKFSLIVAWIIFSQIALTVLGAVYLDVTNTTDRVISYLDQTFSQAGIGFPLVSENREITIRLVDGYSVEEISGNTYVIVNGAETLLAVDKSSFTIDHSLQADTRLRTEAEGYIDTMLSNIDDSDGVVVIPMVAVDEIMNGAVPLF
ncbi:MAG: hypothetical protein AAF702_01495 [Chloroflexota bacterium]